MAEAKKIGYGDLSGRVGVEEIRARGVDVDKLIRKLIANAAAEFSSTYYYYTILRMHLAGYEDYKEILRGRAAGGPGALGTDRPAHLRAGRGVAERPAHLPQPGGMRAGEAARSADRGQHPDAAAGVGAVRDPELGRDSAT